MRRRCTSGDDDGAVLLLALILVTVVAIVISVVLSFADTNLRVTVNAARPEAFTAATADGAAQVAINSLRNSTYVSGANCFPDAAGNLTLPNMTLGNFPATGSSAYVTCTPDPGSGIPVVVSNQNKPGEAILTLGSAANEDGVNVKVSGQGTLLVHGGTFSNSNVNVTLGSLGTDTTDTWLFARGACTGSFVGVGGTGTFPNRTCNYAVANDPRGLDPAYPTPSGPAATAQVQTVPTKCKSNKPNQQVTFQQGIYTDAASLNKLMSSSGCKDGVFVFTPGTYYFDFGTNGGALDQWTVNSGTLVGGNLSPAASAAVAAGNAPAVPGACDNPLKTLNAQGVQFVFGGDSQMYISAANAELCATYSKTSPPLVVYGLKNAVAAPGAGLTIPAETGCVTTRPYPSVGCALIKSDNSPNSKLFLQGTTYAPVAPLDIGLNNNTAQVFEDGVIARTLWLDATGSGVPSGPVIDLPNDSPGYTNGDSVVYLTVYVCSTASTCSSSGKLSLRSKVDIIDPPAHLGSPLAGNRQITVNNWSVQR